MSKEIKTNSKSTEVEYYTPLTKAQRKYVRTLVTPYMIVLLLAAIVGGMVLGYFGSITITKDARANVVSDLRTASK